MLRTRLRTRGGGGGAAAAWTPLNISGCVVWQDPLDSSVLKADTAGTTPATTTVQRWNNKGTYGSYFSQSTATSSPTKNAGAINGVSTLNFDGGDSLSMSGLAGALTGDHYIIVVYRQTVVGNGRLVNFDCPGQFKLQFTTTGTVLSASHTPAFDFSNLTRAAADTNPHIGGQYGTGSAVYAFEDSFTAASAVLQTTGTGNCFLCSDEFGTSKISADIGDVIMFNHMLTAGEITTLKSWLNSRWGFL